MGVAFHPLGRFVYVGNQIKNKLPSAGAFQFDPATGDLTAVDASPFVVPNALLDVTVEAPGKFLYLAFDGGKIGAYAIDQNTGALSAINGSPFPSSQTFGLTTAYAIQ